MVRRHGFEPRSRGSEPRVLPVERAPHRWLGALDLNQVPKIQSLVSCQLDERRMGGTAGAIRTPVLDRRRVALSSSELQPYVWLPETVSNRRHPPCKSGALPAELPGSGRGGRNRTDSGGIMSPARGHLPLYSELACPGRLELPTCWFEASRSVPTELRAGVWRRSLDSNQGRTCAPLV